MTFIEKNAIMRIWKKGGVKLMTGVVDPENIAYGAGDSMADARPGASTVNALVHVSPLTVNRAYVPILTSFYPRARGVSRRMVSIVDFILTPNRSLAPNAQSRAGSLRHHG